MQDEFLAQLQTRLALDPRIVAAWLAGSYGRGAADRWSDIDLHLLLAPGDDSFRTEVRGWLEAIQPLVLYRLMFDGRMINALTGDGLRLDIWLHDEAQTLDPTRVRVLVDRQTQLRLEPPQSEPADPVQTAVALRGQIEEFWRCIALMPTVVGRRERLVSFTGIDIELGLAVDICLRGNGIARDAGVKTLNRFLPAELRAALEHAVALDGLTPESLVEANMRLADIVRQQGRMAAERWGFDYPADLEDAVLAYVAAELEWIRSVDAKD
jgi:hypothetical protein